MLLALSLQLGGSKQVSSSSYMFVAPEERADRLVIGIEMASLEAEMTGITPFDFSTGSLNRLDRATLLGEIDNLIEVLT